MIKILAFAGCLVYYSNASCQYYFYNNHYIESRLTLEAGTAVGGMNCLTDLGGNEGAGGKFIKDLNLATSQWCAGAYLAASYRDAIGAKLEVTFGQVTAADSLLKNVRTVARHRYNRNLSFRSSITEASLTVEICPLSITRSHRGAPTLSLFLLAGLGVFSFSPEAKINGTWVNLPLLQTEGQQFKEYPGRKMYKLTQLNMPVTIGVKYEASALLNLRLEITSRKLWTDYLDDVSKTYVNPRLFDKYLPLPMAAMARRLADRRLETVPLPAYDGVIRGNDKNNDSYFSISLKIGLTLGRQKL